MSNRGEAKRCAKLVNVGTSLERHCSWVALGPGLYCKKHSGILDRIASEPVKASKDESLLALTQDNFKVVVSESVVEWDRMKAELTARDRVIEGLEKELESQKKYNYERANDWSAKVSALTKERDKHMAAAYKLSCEKSVMISQADYAALTAHLSKAREALDRGLRKMQTYVSVYPDDKELRAFLVLWKDALPPESAPSSSGSIMNKWRNPESAPTPKPEAGEFSREIYSHGVYSGTPAPQGSDERPKTFCPGCDEPTPTHKAGCHYAPTIAPATPAAPKSCAKCSTSSGQKCVCAPEAGKDGAKPSEGA